MFINRKGFNSLNILATGGSDKLLYDLVVNAPGSFHDAAIYQMSGVKPYMESRFPRHICLGDSAFPISDVLITPYSTAESNDDRNKALFNGKLFRARSEMTENIYVIWKLRFPIRWLNVKLKNAYEIIIATKILHNLIHCKKILPIDDYPQVESILAIPPIDYHGLVIDDGLNRDQVRLIGRQTRENMRQFMNAA